MAAGADLSRPFTVLEGNLESLSAAEDGNLDGLKQMTNGKPPRHASAAHHCVVTARMLAALDLVRLKL